MYSHPLTILSVVTSSTVDTLRRRRTSEATIQTTLTRTKIATILAGDSFFTNTPGNKRKIIFPIVYKAILPHNFRTANVVIASLLQVSVR